MSDHPYWSEDGDADTVPLADEPQDPPPRPARSQRLRARAPLPSLRDRLPSTARGWLLALGAIPAMAILVLVVIATVAGHGSSEFPPSSQRANHASRPASADGQATRHPLPIPRSRSSRNSH